MWNEETAFKPYSSIIFLQWNAEEGQEGRGFEGCHNEEHGNNVPGKTIFHFKKLWENNRQLQITVAPEPKMLKVVAQILPEQSETTQILKKALSEYSIFLA